MSAELPHGWASPLISDTCDRVVVGFVGPSTQHYSPEGVPFLTGKNVRPGRLVLSDFDRVTRAFHKREAKSQLDAGDVVIVRIGRSGEAAVVPSDLGEANCGGLVIAKQPRAALPEYLVWYLNSPQGQTQLLAEVRGVTRQTLNTKSIARASIPLAPLAEQRRIVAQVELLLAELKACTEHLNKIPGTIKRFRLAVLAAACSGRLTDSWRSSRGEQGVRDTVETDIANSDEHLDVPAGWVHVRLEDVADDVSVGHVGPMAHEYVPNGVPFLRSQNVREFRYDPDGIKFISREFHEQLKKSQLRPGDVVVVRSGNAGVACVIPRTLKTANCSDLVIIRPSDRVVPEYLCLFINSAHARAHVEATKVGIAQGHFNIGDARKMILPLPPVAEQHEIVRNVDSLFAIADTIEEQFAAAAVRVAKTSQSVLAKAFRGELVPTEAELALEEGRDYESAAALLERIWQQPH